MILNFKLVKIDYKYCDYLRKFDYRVIYNAGKKELRPFLGILFKVNNIEYFAPLSSPKKKHKLMKNQIDFIKIDNGNLGAVNFNNMIPVTNSNYSLLNLNKEPTNLNDKKRQNLLKSQLLWLNKNKKNVQYKAENLYFKYKHNKLNKKIKARCCDFILLEKKCKEYNIR